MRVYFKGRLVSEIKGDGFWSFTGANHDGIRILQFFVQPGGNSVPTGDRYPLSWHRFTFWTPDPPTHPPYFVSRDSKGGSRLTLRPGGKDVQIQIGQVWYGLTPAP
jgi:hypothetical protein